MKRRTWLIVVAALALFALAYVGSPFWAARQFKQAALSADVDRIEKAVDFPAVRKSLKAQLTPALTQTMQSDPDLRANPFTGLARIDNQRNQIIAAARCTKPAKWMVRRS